MLTIIAAGITATATLGHTGRNPLFIIIYFSLYGCRYTVAGVGSVEVAAGKYIKFRAAHLLVDVIVVLPGIGVVVIFPADLPRAEGEHHIHAKIKAISGVHIGG